MGCRATVAQRRPVPSYGGACLRVEMRKVHGLAVYSSAPTFVENSGPDSPA